MKSLPSLFGATLLSAIMGLPTPGAAAPMMFVTIQEGGANSLFLPDNGSGQIQFSNLPFFGYSLSGLACDSNFCGGPGSGNPEVELLNFTAACGPGGFNGSGSCPEIEFNFGETIDTGMPSQSTPDVLAQSHIQGSFAVTTSSSNTLSYGGQIRQAGLVNGLIPFNGFF